LPYALRMSDVSGGPNPPQWGHSQPTSGPAHGQPGFPVSGPGYGGVEPPVYPSQAGHPSPYQQPAHPVSGYPGYPGYAPAPGHPAGFAPQYDAYGRPLSDKSKVIAGVLGITLGGFGAGRFYTGHTGVAVAQLIVSLLTCGLGTFWGMIDGVLLLINGGTDAQGRTLRS
jgi:TM2 domain-containing membrane protein YozV